MIWNTIIIAALAITALVKSSVMVSILNELIDERLLFFLLVGEVLDRGS